MFFLEKKFASDFVPAFCKGDKAFLATMSEVQIFDDVSQVNKALNLRVENGNGIIGVKSLLGDGLPWWIDGTSYTSIIDGIAAAEADSSVERIILDVNSPGGYVSGWMPAAMAIQAATKPVTAFVGDLAASAAYMLAAMADEIIARDNLSTLGSIGVAAEYMDFNNFLKSMGIDVHTFTNDESKDKRPDLSTEEGRQIIQDGINDVYHEIEIMIAQGRKVDTEFLRENFGAGRVMLAKDALSAKMIDNIKQKDSLSSDNFCEAET